MIKPNTNSMQKKYWRSLDELQGDPQLDEVIDHDFAAAAPPTSDGVSRRRWLQLMGASVAFGSMMSAGCRYPAQTIAPFAFRPQGRTPGIPQSYSTMLEFGGYAKPVVALSYDGRPIKLDGNPDHPDSGGVSDIFTQSTILELYDPDRSRNPARKGDDGMSDVLWDDVINNFKPLLAGRGVAVLAEPCSSPTVHRLKQVMLDANSDARWFEFTSVSDDQSDAGSRMAFGDVYRPQLRLEDAKVIVAIDADPLGDGARAMRNTLGFTQSRDADQLMHDSSFEMSRVYSVESEVTKTGCNADHRLALRFSQIASFLAALEAIIDRGSSQVDTAASNAEQILAAMAEDLLKHKGAGAVVVGACQPPEVHARAFRINSKLDNLGKTVELNQPAAAAPKSGVEQLGELTEAINQGQIETLLILGGNPVFFAPSDLNFADALAKVANSCHLSLYRDETTLACKWHMNAAHPLESWGDGTSPDGSVCLAQPMINPLFGGKSAIELLAIMTGQDEYSHDEHAGDEHAGDEHAGDEHAGDEHGEHAHGNERDLGLMMVHETNTGSLGGEHAEDAWRRAVQAGYIDGTAAQPASPTLTSMNLPADDGSWKERWNGSEPELIFRPSPSIYDGRFGNNGWLQEMPEFVTKLTWDNAALVSPETADHLQLDQGKIVNLKVGEKAISLPVYILPGLAYGTICTWLGYGREAAGRVAGLANLSIDSAGHDVRPLRTSGNWWSVPAVTTDPTSTVYKLATTQDHFRIDQLGIDEISHRMGPDGALIREGTFDSYRKFLEEHPHDPDHSDHGHDDEHAEESEDSQAAEESGSEESHDDHGHGEHWPGKHHLHFKNFDLTEPVWVTDPVAHRWGMGIDLNKCTGCNACVIACQAENNIPVVGKEQVSRGREMQWMRIDRYFITSEGDNMAADPGFAFQPLTCQQCEKAPCETVCPVAATVHSDEGLNVMVYNRCIGTRYCGNNCPFKVRRFNYFNYTDSQTFLKIPGDDRLQKADLQLQSLMMNPEVTVRSRGVMEKCTYCVQRIQNAKIQAKAEGNRPLAPNEIRTACQDACPAQAITFGDLQVADADVSKDHANPRSYLLLEELNVIPRTRYLARVRNPHPDLNSHSGTAAAH